MILSPTFFFLGRRKTHVLAHVIVLDNANTHPFVRRNSPELCNVNVIKVLHFDGVLIRMVSGWASHCEFYAGIFQLFDRRSVQATTVLLPETHADLQLPQIIVAYLFRNRIKRKYIYCFQENPSGQVMDFPPTALFFP